MVADIAWRNEPGRLPRVPPNTTLAIGARRLSIAPGYELNVGLSGALVKLGALDLPYHLLIAADEFDGAGGIINTSGVDGEDGQTPKKAGEGRNGQKGQDGTGGKDATNITVLAGKLSNLRLLALGGHGGDGSPGGEGGDGFETKSGKLEPPGDGGDGGDGRGAGHGGSIRIVCIDEPSGVVRESSGGKAGENGPGGKGGLVEAGSDIEKGKRGQPGRGIKFDGGTGEVTQEVLAFDAFLVTGAPPRGPGGGRLGGAPDARGDVPLSHLRR